MNDHPLVHNVHEAGLPRRNFLRNSLVLAAPIAIGGLSFSFPAAAYTPPVRARGSTTRNVKNYGAYGDGRHDDTAAIQAAINSLPSTGGTVYIPAGTYLIDTNKKVRLRSLMHLKLDPGAILKAKTSSLSRHYLVYILDKSDVEISGGQLIGDRDTHNYSSGGTHEWGHGIQILGGRRVTVRDLRVSKCTGDGVCIGGGSYDVVIDNIIATVNRRQGLSITNCSNIRVYDSEFSYSKGTSPECGIDIEPDEGGSCNTVLISNCRMNNNAKYGVNIWKRTTGVTITGCTLERNGSLGMGTVGISGLKFTNNIVRYNSATGVVYNTGTRSITHSGNLSYGNYTRLGTKTRTPFTLTGWASKIERDVLRRSEYTLTIGTNNYK